MITRTRIGTLLSIAALAMLVACGGGSGGGSGDAQSLLASANNAMSEGKWDTAAENLEKAIAALGTDGDADTLRNARVNHAVCTIRMDNGDEGKKAFLALADSTDLTWKDYKNVGEALTDAEFDTAAIEVLDQGVKKFPANKDDLMTVITSITSKKALSPEAEQKLKDLGYIK